MLQQVFTDFLKIWLRFVPNLHYLHTIDFNLILIQYFIT